MGKDPIAIEECERLCGHRHGVAHLELRDDLHHLCPHLAGYPPSRRWLPLWLRPQGPRIPGGAHARAHTNTDGSGATDCDADAPAFAKVA